MISNKKITFAAAIATTNAINLQAQAEFLGDIGGAFEDALDWTAGAGETAWDWTKGAGVTVYDFSFDNEVFDSFTNIGEDIWDWAGDDMIDGFVDVGEWMSDGQNWADLGKVIISPF